MSYRIRTPLQQIVTVFVLVLFLATVFFGFASMMHDPVAGMESDCPFSVMGEPLCPQNLAAAVVHHISTYQSFLAVFAASGITALILALLVALAAALLFSVAPLLFRPPARVRYFFDHSPNGSRDSKTARWLSLLEHSPSTI